MEAWWWMLLWEPVFIRLRMTACFSLDMKKADGDLQFYNKNGDIMLTLPSSLAF